MANKPPVIDFTDTQELGPIAPDNYVFAITKWAYVTSSGGHPMVKVEHTVVKPSSVKGKVFGNIITDNEYGRGELLNLIAATDEFGTKDKLKTEKKFVPPAENDMIGLQFAGRTKIRPGTGDYSDQAIIAKYMTVSEYDEKIAAAAAV